MGRHEFEGYITGVAAFGLHRTVEHFAEGLVHVSKADDYYRLSNATAARTRKPWLGDKVMVQVVRNMDVRQIDQGSSKPERVGKAARPAPRAQREGRRPRRRERETP
jgi:predicted RNA-binding protein with RPS1 domain